VKDYPLTQKTKDAILALYPEYKTVYGPYYREDGRQHIFLYDSINKLRRTVSFPKILFELLHGVRLKDDETVDHIDNNYRNNDISNLQILKRADNIRKAFVDYGKVAKYVEFKCPMCGEDSRKKESDVRNNRRVGKAGPFCGRRCAGKFSTKIKRVMHN
jgi:predicted RNA-binding Zn-ribbon protein involved in translation (DUF1610 family)